MALQPEYTEYTMIKRAARETNWVDNILPYQNTLKKAYGISVYSWEGDRNVCPMRRSGATGIGDEGYGREYPLKTPQLQ